MNNLSIRERIAELQKQIDEICREDFAHKKIGKARAPRDIGAHNQRILRAKHILEEIAKLRTGAPGGES